MFLLSFLRRLFTRQAVDESQFCSIVLLLREPHFFRREELMEAGCVGFGKRFDGEEDPMYFVVQDAPVTMMKAGIYAMHLQHHHQPYLGDKEAAAKTLFLKRQQDAWLAHTAWASIDLWNQDVSNSDGYTALARFAINLADQNCSGVFLPKHNILLTNDGQAEEWLHDLIRGKQTF
jgi:hypothetical protein